MKLALAFALIVTASAATTRAQAGTLTQLPSSNVPVLFGSPVRPTMAFDAARRRIVLLTGMLLGSGIETWEYDGTSWTLMLRLTSSTGPLVTASNMIFDEVRQRCLIATTTGHTIYLSEWSQGAWNVIGSPPLVPPVPGGGVQVALVRDPLRNEAVVLAGGRTFHFTGAQVTNGVAGPTTSMAVFDPSRGEILAITGNTMQAYNGVAWRNLPGFAPGGLMQMVHDPVLQRVLGVDGELLEWEGTIWRRAVTLGASLPGGSSALTTDPQTGAAVVAVLSSNGVPGSTWLYQEMPTVRGQLAVFGAGCAGPAGIPTWVTPASMPRFGRPFACQLQGVPTGPQNMTILMLGTNAATLAGQALPVSMAPYGAPGCEVWLEPSLVVPMFAQTLTALYFFDVPASPLVVGQQFYMQAATLVPGWNALSAMFSDAASAVIGTR